jgi:predicted nuclease of restriction endonuclease-like (RecB) superfamily
MNGKKTKADIRQTTVSQFTEIKELIRSARNKALVSVNTETIKLYWNTGKYVSEKLQASEWGDSVVSELAEYLKKEEPVLKGFSKQGIYRMVQFYETYTSDEFVSTVLRQIQITDNKVDGFISTILTQISWSSHLYILYGNKKPEERLFYLLLAKKERLSVRELKRQIDSSMFERTMMGNLQLSEAIQSLPQSVENVFRDTYSLELLNLPDRFDESDVKRSITQNIKQFLLEFGRDFSFMGEEYRVQVGNHDFFIDLLFYNRELQCLVAIELKAKEFTPGDLGQLEFYLEALDRDVKKPHENPSIGILLCKEKDDTVVEYALSRSASPALIADYERSLPDKKRLQERFRDLLEMSERDEFREGDGDE